MIPLYGDWVYFDDWLREKGYLSQTGLRDKMLSSGYEKEYEELIEKLEEEFFDWCEEEDLVGQTA